jgi:DNA-binding CsgD family transcriptional regulator
MHEQSDPVVAAVDRWLAVGRDVLVRGDVGSGKSHLLDRLEEGLARRIGYRVVLLRPRRQAAPFGPLLAHPSYPATGHPATERGLTRWLRGELAGRRNVLLLDDLDRFDPETLVVVGSVLRTTGTLAVSTLTDAPLGALDAPAADLVAERAPAQIRTRSLGLSAAAGLLTEALGGPASAGLVASLSTRSAGNPRVMIALADAARFAGLITPEHGVWTKTGSLDAAPTDAVAHALLTRLPPAEVRALTTLARSAPVGSAEAEQLVDPELLDGLVARGRVVGHALGEGQDVLAVSPPALAQALRDHGPGRSHPGDHDEEGVGMRARPVEGWDHLITASDEDDEYWRWSAELAGMVHGRQTAEEDRLRAVWQVEPTAAHACALLTVLMRRVAPDEVEAVLAGTTPGEQDTPQHRELLALLAARWHVWRTARPGRARPRTAPTPDDDDPTTTVRDAVLDAVRAGAADAELLAAGADESAFLPGWADVVRAGTLVDAGRPDLALRICEQVDAPGGTSGLTHYLDGIHGVALLMLDRAAEAEQLARQHLDRAVTDLDATGIRVHASVLAEVLVHAGQPEAAWRVLSTALRLGPAGPIENTFYRRALTLGTVLRARAGDATLARALLADLEAAPAAYRPVLLPMRVLAGTALAETTAAPDPVDEELWQTGLGYARQGLALPALTCWLLHPGPHRPARLRQVQALFAEARLPVLAPLLALHEALVDPEPAVLAERLAATRHLASDGLVRTATALLAGLTPGLIPSPRPAPDLEQIDPAGSARPGPARLLGTPLTEREREIAQCVQDGMSNRDIAAEFSLSPRTVENHVSRVLHKLGLRSRRDLASHLGR